MTPDYATWLTKQQAADRIGCSTKTVEQFAKDRKIEQAVWRRDGRGMPLAVYDPTDVARVAAERRGEAVPFVVPPVGNGNGHGSVSLARPAAGSPDAEAQQALAAGLTAFALALQSLTSHSSESSQSSQSFEKLFLTIAEASAVSGLSRTYLKRACASETLKALRDGRRWKIKRTDLETL